MRKPSEVKIGEYTLEEILVRHSHWLNKDCDGWEIMRANLNNTNLCYVDLSNADLSIADLCYAKMSYANLCNAKLSGVNLSGTNLYNADLCYANLHDTVLCNADLCYAKLNNAELCDANLRDVNLRNADLTNANLCDANLRDVNLRDANLCNANLCGANLRNVNLSNANLRNVDLDNVDLYNADLRSVDLNETKNIPYIPLACPSEGSFTAWKKVKRYLIKLEIPESAKRSSATSQKCRASEAKVLGIYTLDGEKTDLKNIVNRYQDSVINYIVGETVYPDSFDENRWDECSHGIHFFINKQDAINYIYY